jgi:hypothetical protein
MVALILQGAVRDVPIVVDRDASGAGEQATRRAGRRWLAEGRRLVIPHAIGDAADLIPACAGTAECRAA